MAKFGTGTETTEPTTRNGEAAVSRNSDLKRNRSQPPSRSPSLHEEDEEKFRDKADSLTEFTREQQTINIHENINPFAFNNLNRNKNENSFKQERGRQISIVNKHMNRSSSQSEMLHGNLGLNKPMHDQTKTMALGMDIMSNASSNYEMIF